ncbi:hypothetical protein NC652_022135 [Populus alba x Populus x berolinensis]|nr:hypothetical protein NC652_022135 [Populus alba x Populus x berolinensis]
MCTFVRDDVVIKAKEKRGEEEWWGERREERRQVKGKESMKAEKKLNAIRSGIVVIGALAFGYLTLQIGFKPFLLKAQQHEEQQQQSLHSQETSFNDQQQQQ